MDDLSKKIEAYSEKVQGHREKKANLQGQLESSLKRINQAGFDAVDDAEKFIEDETNRLDIEEIELKDDVAEFERIYATHLEADAD